MMLFLVRLRALELPAFTLLLYLLGALRVDLGDFMYRLG
jgi:hypothetical protein